MSHAWWTMWFMPTPEGQEHARKEPPLAFSPTLQSPNREPQRRAPQQLATRTYENYPSMPPELIGSDCTERCAAAVSIAKRRPCRPCRPCERAARIEP